MQGKNCLIQFFQSGTSQAKHYPHFVQVKESVRNRKRCYSVINPVPGAVRPATE